MGEDLPTQKLPLKEGLDEFFQEVPIIFPSFRRGIQPTKLRFLYFAGRKEQKVELTIEYYPFQTVQEIRLKVALQLSALLKYQVDALHVSLLVPLSEAGEEQVESYVSFTNIWRIPTKKESSQSVELDILNPFDQAVKGPNPNFVNPMSGEAKAIRNDEQSRMLIEDMIYKRFGNDIIVVHVFLFQNIVRAFPSTLSEPLKSSAQWYGKIFPYFDQIPFATAGVLSQEQKSETENYVQYLTYCERLLGEYEKILSNYSQQIVKQDKEKYAIHFGGIKYLKLLWREPEKDAKDVELLFYELPVTQITPFMRLIQPDKEAISKILIKPGSFLRKEPDIKPAKLFIDWATEDSAVPEADYLFMKTKYHEYSLDEPMNMYGTLRITADKTAAYVLVPPKQKRYLETRKHLHDFPRLLQLALKDTPYGSMVPEIHKMSVLCGIRLSIQDKPLTLDILRARVEAMSYVFQEIKPLPGSNALTLRFKLVSNFQTDDRIHQFIKQVEERFELKSSDRDMKQMAEYVSREFGFSEAEAMRRIFRFYQEKIELVPVDTDAKDFIAKYNYGIDIVIRSAHPQYTFDIYGLESESTFHRLLTCLTILFASKNKEWVAAQQLYRLYNKAAVEVGKAFPQQETKDEDEDDFAAFLTKKRGDVKQEQKEDEKKDDDDEGWEWNNGEAGDTGIGDDIDATVDIDADAIPDEKVPVEEVMESMTRREEPPPVAQEETNVELETEGATGKKGLKAQQAKKKSSKKKENPLAEYFLQRLKALDQSLFDFKTDKGRDYSGLCQANYMKQPLAITESQFEVLISKQGKERFVRYGINPKTRQPFQETPPASGSYITVMAYGSSPSNIRYYLCPQYFCYKDELVLFQEDIDSTIDKKGRPKIKGSCPFCGGVIIPKGHRNNPQTVKIGNEEHEETIFDRRVFETPDKKIHDEIGFLTKKAELHPSKSFWIPCCFITPDLKRKKRGDDIQPKGEAAAAYKHLFAEETKPTTTVAKTQPFLSYKIVLDRPETRYIQGGTKFPLDVFSSEGPQIGLMLAGLDEFFEQNPNNMVARDFTKSKLQPNGRGFLRLAVQNGRQYLNDSFLSALAPYLSENNIRGVKEKLKQEIKPPIFMNLNYGNLMLEFYKADIEIPATVDLAKWTGTYLPNVEYSTENKHYIERIYRSYINFLAYLDSETELKEYRHFAHYLSTNLPIRQSDRAQGETTENRGILFLILEYNEDQSVNIRCPPFGYDEEKHRNCDYGILLKHYTGYYEPIFYVENRASTSTTQGLSRSDLIFQAADEMKSPLQDPQFAWPTILRRRINEFRMNCITNMKSSLFTMQRGINPNSLLTLSAAVDLLTGDKIRDSKSVFHGVIKDIYNHIVGITIQVYREDRYVVVPVVDDGKMTYFNKKTYLDWDLVPAAPAEIDYKFYQSVVAAQIPAFEGYKVKLKVVSRIDKNAILALQLNNGIYIPTGSTPQANLPTVPFITVDDYKEFRKGLEYEINKAIYPYDETNKENPFKETEMMSKEKEITMEQDDLEEIYQHFRYTFANWLTSDDVSRRAKPEIIEKINDTVYRRKELLDKVEGTIFNRNLPLFEKRQRLYLSFGSEVENWLYQEEYKRKPIESLLRIDCRIQNEEKCMKAARCKWVAAEGRCLLHAPKEGRVGGKENVDVIKLFVYRLIDELIRFPEKRKQLMRTGVPGIVNLTDAVLLGDTQYVVPENTLAWQDLWRMEWVPREKEEAKYYEEMSVPPTTDLVSIKDSIPKPPGPIKQKIHKIVLGKDLKARLKELQIGEEVKEVEETTPVTKPIVEPIKEERKFKFKKEIKFGKAFEEKLKEIKGEEALKPHEVIRKNMEEKVVLPLEPAPKPLTELPKTVVEPPKPLTELPKTVEEPPKPLTELPKTVVEPEEESPDSTASTENTNFNYETEEDV